MSNPDRINLNVLIETTSLNNPERTGVYYVTGNNIGALPPGFSTYGILLCMRSPYSLHPTNSNCVYIQEYTDVYGKHASRSFNNGVWTSWVTTATKDDLENLFRNGGFYFTYSKADDFTNILEELNVTDAVYIARKANAAVFGREMTSGGKYYGSQLKIDHNTGLTFRKWAGVSKGNFGDWITK